MLDEQSVNSPYGPSPQALEGQAASSSFVIAGGSAEQRTPVVAFNSTDGEYLAVWTDNATPETIRGQRVSQTGGKVGGEITIATRTVGPPFLPKLLFNPVEDSYMILWSEINGNVISQPYVGDLDAYNLYALPLSSAGAPLSAEPTLITDQLTFYGNLWQGCAAALNDTADEYLVVWDQPPGTLVGIVAHPHRAVARRLGPSGALIGDEVVLRIGVVDSLSLAYNHASDEYLVTWDRYFTGLTGYELYAQRLDPVTLSALGPELSLTNSLWGWQVFPEIVNDPDLGLYLVVWHDDQSSTFEYVRAQFVQPGTGSLIGSNLTMLGPIDGLAHRTPRIAYSIMEHYYLVAAEAPSGIVSRYVSVTGEPSGAPFIAASGAIEPDVAARIGGDERNRLWLTVWTSAADIYAGFVANPVIPSDGVLSSGGDLCLASYGDAQGTEGGPINTRTGGYDLTVSDLSVPTAAGPLEFQRSYSSLATDLYTQTLGVGWTYKHEPRLIFPSDAEGEPGVVLFKPQSANRYEYIENADGTYSPAPGVCGSLTRDDGPPVSYLLKDNRQTAYVFDEEGQLLSWTNATGHVLSYEYDMAGRLEMIEDETGLRYLALDHDAQGRIESVTDHTGRQIEFAYDGAGDLVSATDPLGQLWTYAYDGEHRLTQVTDPRGIPQERTEYDAEGRAVRQYNGADELVVEITYNPDGTSTIVDARGNTSTDAYDARHTLTDETDALGGAQAKVYDVNFRPTSITDEDGDMTSLAWSGDGANLTQVVDAEGNQTDLTYDDLNNLTEVVDPRGFLTSYTYSGSLMTSSTDALGNMTTYSYTPEGYLASVTDARGHNTHYTYDAYGQRTSMTDALGRTWTYTYDELGRLVETTDPLGRVNLNEFDDGGRLIRTTRNYDPSSGQNEDDDTNIITEYAYDEIGNQVAVTDTYGRITHSEYDDAGRLIRTTDPAGNETVNTYDEAGNLIATTDALGRTTTYEYDELNRLVGTTDPLGNTSASAYNPDGTLASTTDANGGTTTYTYDDLKRVVAVTDALGDTITTSYDEAGNVIAKTDALGRTTTFEYDALNRLIRQTDPLGGVTEHFYDEVGNLVQTIDPNGYATTNVYDGLNRQISVTDALGNTTDVRYNTAGNRSRVTDANEHETYYIYDQLDRLIEVDDPLDNYIETTYDAVGNVTRRTDANGNSTTYAYDELNRLVQETDPLGGETSYVYDAVGNMLSVTDANGNTSEWSYDELNRQIAFTDANGNTTTTDYDAIGNILATTNALDSTTSFAYDALNRQVAATDPLGNTTEYAYDDVGNRTSMTDANGVATLYEYDALDRLTAVVENFQGGAEPDPQTNVRTEYTYDPVGNRLTITDANGHVTTSVYDDVNRLIGETDAMGNSTEYEFDPVGNRVSLTDADDFTSTYAYDDADRLTTIDYPDPDADVTFAYDAVGNRVEMTDGVGSTTWSYDALNRPTDITDPFGGTVSYAYDAVGNRTWLGYPDGRTVDYAYDAAGLLVEVLDWEGQVTSYSYDPANRLETADLPNGVVSTYAYDEAGQLTNLTHEAESVTLSSFDYTYDAVGNRVQVVEALRQPGSLPEYKLFLPLVLNGAQEEDSESGEAVATAAASTLEPPSPTATLTPTPGPVEEPRLTLAPTGTWTPTSWPTDTETPTSATTATGTPSPSATETGTPTALGTATPEQTTTQAGTGAFRIPGLAALIPPRGDPGAMLQGDVVTRTIDYSYDTLYRLTAADYDDGTFFHYTYDTVGNRLTQDALGGTDTYAYDEANELIELNGVAFGWDDEGNLLSDGVSTYTYDHANRLSSVVQGSDVYTFAYNGLGDRLQQTVNGDVVDYTLDLNAGLTQVLADGLNVYLYGVGRIGEEQPTGWQYHLGDALRSVRELVDPAQGVALALSYEPYGRILGSTGDAVSQYGFAGEWADSTGLIHLRARYLNATHGRFLQRDIWTGSVDIPYTQNPYPYAASNPVNVRDPSGRCWDWSPDKGLMERIPFAPSDGPCPGSVIEGPDGTFDFSGVLSEDPLASLVDSGLISTCAVPWNATSDTLMSAAPGPLWVAVEYVREATVRVYLSSGTITSYIPPFPIPYIPIFVSSRTVEALSWDSTNGEYPEVIESVSFSLLPDAGLSVVVRVSQARGVGVSVSLGVLDCTVSVGAISLQLSCMGSAAQVKLNNLVQRRTWISQSSRIADFGGYLGFGTKIAFQGVSPNELHYYVLQTSYDRGLLETRFPEAIVFEGGQP
jgi:RHS repeat-associated protein